MNQRNKKLMIVMPILSLILFVISIIVMDDISFLFAGIATILIGITLFLVIYEVTNHQKNRKNKENYEKKDEKGERE